MSLHLLLCTISKWTLHTPFPFFSKLRFWPKIFRCCVLRWGRCPRHDQPSEQLRPTLFHFAPPPPATQLTRFTNNCNLSQPPYQPLLVYMRNFPTTLSSFLLSALHQLDSTWLSLRKTNQARAFLSRPHPLVGSSPRGLILHLPDTPLVQSMDDFQRGVMRWTWSWIGNWI